MIKQIVFLLIFTAGLAHSQNKFNFSERAKKRESTRWTLAEWLAQKERNKMMDMWLSMNSPSPFEFSLLGANTNYKKHTSTVEAEHTITSLEASAYARIFGLSIEYEKRSQESENDLTGLFNLRILGDSIQTSGLTLHYGQRTRTFSGLSPISVVRNQFAQVSLQIYLSQYFGINGYYRAFQPFSDSYLGNVTGYQNQAGIFIDFEFIRVFGYWFREVQKNSSTTNSDAEIKREGVKTGLQFFF